MGNRGKNSPEKFIQPQIPVVAKMADVGINRYQIDTGVSGNMGKGCDCPIKDMILHPPLDYTADVKTMHHDAWF